MRLFEIKNSGYVYHASHTPNNDRKALVKSIYMQGLKPSKEGYDGPGVYFAHEPDGRTYDHTDPNFATMLRVKFDDLISLYGKYSENGTGVQWDDEEIVVPGVVPADYLEVEVSPGKWEELNDVYQELSYEAI